MKLLRHILSHLLLISFLVAVVSVFYYRALLLPNDVVGKIDEVVNDVYPPAIKFASNRDYFWSIRGERIVSFDDFNLFKKEDVVPVKEEKTTLASDDSNNKTSTKETETKSIEVAAVKETLEKAKAVVAETKEKTLSNIPVEKASGAKALESVSVDVKDSDMSSERDLLADARKAFNLGEISISEKLYLELTRLEQDNPDAFGELGNVYYSQGKWDKAGQAYYEAAVRLIAEGNYNQVAYLQRVINGLDREHAEKLSQLMMRQ
ncbi:MAG: hypothetical protein KAT06_08510 [Gammaproteobacteria bacterium]|nr:hypothetical protein [Gammaproteobacteria bacterium]